MGYLARSWPRGLVLFLQQKRTMPRNYDETMNTLKKYTTVNKCRRCPARAGMI